MGLRRTGCILLALLPGLGLQTPAGEIHNAVRAGDAEQAFALIKADTGVVAAVTEDKLTPLHIAALEGNVDLAELLLTNKAPVNAAGAKQQTPLHLAMFSGNRAVAELLLDHGAEINARDAAGDTPLQLAARRGDRDMVELLLDRKADPAILTADGKTAAETASAAGYSAVAELLQKRLTVLVGDLGDPSRLVFKGLKTYKAEDIQVALKATIDFMAISHPFSPMSEYVAALQKKIEAGYRRGGFPDAQIRVRHDPAAAQIIVEVEEGPRYFCGDIRVHGSGPVSPSEITARLLATNQPPRERVQGFAFLERPVGSPSPDPAAQFPFGEPLWARGAPASFLDEKVQSFAAMITNLFQDRGYFFPDVKVQIVPDPATSQGHLQIDIAGSGPRTRFDPIETVGNSKNSREELLEYLGLKPGMEATGGLLRQVDERLWASARFLTNAVSLGSPEPDGRVPLRIAVLEYGPSPPLKQGFSDAEQGLLKMRSWLAGLGARREDLVLDCTSTSSKGAGRNIRLHVVISPSDGLVFSVAEGEFTNCAYGLVITTNFFGLFCPIDERKFVVPTGEAQLQITAAVSSGPTNQSGNAFNLTLAAGFAKRDDWEPPYRFVLTIPPVASTSMFHKRQGTNWLDGEILTIKDDTVTFALDAASGRIRQVEVVDDDPEMTVKGRFAAGVMGEFIRDLTAQMATVPNAYASNAPLSGLIAFLAETACSPKFGKVFAGLEIPENLPVTPELIRKGRLLESLAPLDRLIPTIAATMQGTRNLEFVIPQTYHIDIFGVAANWVTRNAGEIFPPKSWLWTTARETGFVLQGRARYTDQALQEMLDSSDTGPFACLTLSYILKSFQPAPSREAASRGLSRLSTEYFLQDCRTLLDTNALLGQCLANLAASLARLDENELRALAGTESTPAVEALRAGALSLREHPSQPVGEVLEPPLRAWWEKELKQVLERALQDMATDVNELARRAIRLYEAHRGEQDTAEATRLLRQAAQKGHPGAQLFLAQIFERGPDSTRNMQEAVTWYGHAATNGVNAAAIALGDLYGEGLSVAQDRFQAYVWYGVAARRGERIALALRRGVERRLSDDQIAKAQKIIDAITADYSGPRIEERGKGAGVPD